MTPNDLDLPTFTHFVPPRFGPRRDLTYYSEEPSITRICRAMGKEPQPWQRYVWAVGTEFRYDGAGRKHYRYSDVLITVPRQSGKTTLLQPLRIKRMIDQADARLFCTAQSQKHASKRMLAMIDTVSASHLGPLFKARRGKGDAGLRLLANNADLTQFTPNEEAAHGETSPYFDLDEIWAFSLELGNAIMGGIRPSQVTLHGIAQRWFTSTMGTLQSGFMNELVEKGRAGERPGLCFIEYSMPDNLDPYDPATWWQFHPALGNTITVEALQEDIDLPAGEWTRAYMNRLTEVSDSFMPLENWDDLAAPDEEVPALDAVTVGFEIAPSNENAAVVAAWHDSRGRAHGRVLHQAPGTIWLIGYLEQLAQLGAARFAADDGGPVRRILDALERKTPIRPRRLTFNERRLADQTLISAARDEATLTHDGSQPLRLAVASAQLRQRNGLEMIDRDRSLQPVPALIALSVACYADTHIETETRPIIVT